MHYKISCLIVVIFLVACGGGGSSNDNATASKNGGAANNSGNENTGGQVDSEALRAADVAINVTKRAIANSSGTLPTGVSQKPQQKLPLKPTATEEEVEYGTCGGQFVSRSNTDEINYSEFPVSYWVEAEYDEYCLDFDGYQITYDGTISVRYNYSSGESYYIAYAYDLVYTSNISGYGSGHISMSEECSKTSGSEAVCSSYSNYSDNDVEYQLEQPQISGDENSGYSFNGLVMGSDGVEYQIRVENIVFCDEGTIASGSIEIDFESETARLEFISCSEYTLTYQGVSEILQQ